MMEKNKYSLSTNSELKIGLETTKKEFDELKINVANGLQRLNELSNDYNNLLAEIKKRS